MVNCDKQLQAEIKKINRRMQKNGCDVGNAHVTVNSLTERGGVSYNTSTAERPRYIREYFRKKDVKILHRAILDPHVKLNEKIKMWEILIDSTKNEQIKAEYVVASGIRTKEMMKRLFTWKLQVEVVIGLFVEEKIRCNEIFVYILENYVNGNVISIDMADDGKISLKSEHRKDGSICYSNCGGSTVYPVENNSRAFNLSTGTFPENDNHIDDISGLDSSSLIKTFAEHFVRLSPKNILRILAASTKTIRLPGAALTTSLLQKIKLKKGETLPKYVETLCMQCRDNDDLIYECYNTIKNCRLRYDFVKELFVTSDEHATMMKIRELLKIYYRTVVKNRENVVGHVKEMVKSGTGHRIGSRAVDTVTETINDNDRMCQDRTVEIVNYDEEEAFAETVALNRVKKTLAAFVKKYPRKRHIYKDAMFTLHHMNKDYISALELVKKEKSNRKYRCMLKISKELALNEIDKALEIRQDKELEMLRLRVICNKSKAFVMNFELPHEHKNNKQEIKNSTENAKLGVQSEKGGNGKQVNETYANYRLSIVKMCNMAEKWDDDGLNLFSMRYMKEINDNSSFDAFFARIRKTEFVFYEKYVFLKRNDEWKRAVQVLKSGLKATKSSFLHHEYLFVTNKLHRISFMRSNSNISLYFKAKTIINGAYAGWQCDVLNILGNVLHRNGDFFIIYFYALLSMLFEECSDGHVDGDGILKYFFNNLYFYISMGNWKGYYFVQMMDYLEDDTLKKLCYGIELMKKDRTFHTLKNEQKTVNQ
ncbi:hypothetical protein VCUG_01098 [Vavraia culicis subsp. floridensis]|uniref:Uncharacterized protein n=1 Tax=Vavraia culicis (isolate floridensis) TaxID=948595 RepID=L2GVS7_VAVCU|nr:uncharacterized protein VCUG_01098 [Vavraia culicis subsp. floridensis]ELA47447.1 hypothetical protein VCUG_01098 [Vavraia culicis subsp. floridensis]